MSRDIRIIVATHKRYKMPEDTIYLPLHVGRLNKQDIGYVGDNTGDNISEKNSYYNEMTGVYWAWKNLYADYIGLAHYRRHFKTNTHKRDKDPYRLIASRIDIEKLLNKYDVILPQKRFYYIETNRSHFEHLPYSISSDLTCLQQVIAEVSPEYSKALDNMLQRHSAHMFNMFIMKREIFCKYCEWVFSILGELDKRIDMSNRIPIQARYYVSEFLMDTWIETNKIKYGELKVLFIENECFAKKGWMALKRRLKINYAEQKQFTQH